VIFFHLELFFGKLLQEKFLGKIFHLKILNTRLGFFYFFYFFKDNNNHKIFRTGKRLEKIEKIDKSVEFLEEIIDSSWLENPQSRPTITSILQHFPKL